MNNTTPRLRLTRKVILGLILLATISSQTVNCAPTMDKIGSGATTAVKFGFDQTKCAAQFALKNAKNVFSIQGMVATFVTLGMLSYFLPQTFVAPAARYFAYAAGKGAIQLGTPVAQSFMQGVMSGIWANKLMLAGTLVGGGALIFTGMATAAIMTQTAEAIGLKLAPIITGLIFA